MTAKPEISGVLPVLKPRGPTSHDVVQIARRVLHQRAIGHIGTLDPAAGGLLVLCIGAHTKLVPYLMECDKTYSGEMALGLSTNTDDSEGEPVLFGDASGVSLDSLRAVALRFTGDIEQVPPRYAAVKVAGKKLYEYARKGIEVHIDPRPVSVRQFDIQAIEPIKTAPVVLDGAGRSEHLAKMRSVRFTVRVSAGTYVRALARDIGQELGCGGYLLSLWRNSIGHFSDNRAIPLELLQENPQKMDEFRIGGGAALDPEKYPKLTLLTAFKERLSRGQPINDRMLEQPAAAANLRSGAACGLCDEQGSLLAMVEATRFDEQTRANAAYASRFLVHFKILRVFPGGLH